MSIKHDLRKRAEDTPTPSGLVTVPARHVPLLDGVDWLKAAWRLFLQTPAHWIALGLVTVIIQVVLFFIPGLGSLISILSWPLLTAGMLNFGYTVATTGKADWKSLLIGFKDHFDRLIGIALIYLLIVIIAMTLLVLLIGGSIGLGVISYSFDYSLLLSLSGLMIMGLLLIFLVFTLILQSVCIFAPGLVIYSNLGAWDAIQESFKATLSNWLPLLVFSLLSTILVVIGCLPLFLGLLIVGPLIIATLYPMFLDLFQGPNRPSALTDPLTLRSAPIFRLNKWDE